MLIRRFGVLSVAKMLGVLYGLMGLIFGAIFALLALVGAGMGAAMEDEAAVANAFFGAFFGVGAIIFLPLLYGFFGFVFGALTAFLYNIVAGIAGGVEVEVDTPRPAGV